MTSTCGNEWNGTLVGSLNLNIIQLSFAERRRELSAAKSPLTIVTASFSVAGRIIAPGTSRSMLDHLASTSLNSSADESSRMTVFDDSFCFNDERKFEKVMMIIRSSFQYVESLKSRKANKQKKSWSFRDVG